MDVTTAIGKLLVHRAVEAGPAASSRGAFDLLPSVGVRRLVVVAYDRSAKGGSRIDVVRVPVTLGS